MPFARPLTMLLLLSSTPLAVGCLEPVETEPGRLGQSAGAWMVFDDPFGDGRENPANQVRGTAEAQAMDQKRMRLTLRVAGLPPDQTFGSHLHKLSCEEMKAGGHYQHEASPTTATDPTYANSTNEAWLDFTTNDKGEATAMTEVGWIPRSGQARAILIHAEATREGGVAGAKLACLPMIFAVLP